MNTFKISAYIALGFFSVGTLLFILQLIIGSFSYLVVIGFYYFLAAIISNLIIILTLTVRLFFYENRLDTVRGMIIILANLPIALTYKFILLQYNFI